MTINQISIFLENKFGRLNEILSILKNENIRVIAATVADTSDYGILRLITTDQQRAYVTLLENKVSANMNEVLAISVDSNDGKYYEVIDTLVKNGIAIEYMYCFSTKERSILILRTNNMKGANEVAQKLNVCTLSEAELLKL